MFQQAVRQHLQQQWRNHRLPHAILLDGPEGAGHMAVALDFARLLLCQTVAGETDGHAEEAAPSLFGESTPAADAAPLSPSAEGADMGLAAQAATANEPLSAASSALPTEASATSIEASGTPTEATAEALLQPCEHCSGCAMTHVWQHPDLHFVFPVIRPKNASSTTRVVSDLWLKEWREMLRESEHFDLQQWEERMGIENQQPQIFADESDELVRKLSLTPSQGGWRVVVMWLPELMHTACANKLLKLLEEPPSRTLFLLVAHRAELILPTILSRTQRITVRGIPEGEMATALQRQRGLSESDATYIAHTAQGNYVRALRLLTVGHDEQEFLDMFILLMRKCYLRDIKEMHAWSERMASWGRERQKAFLDYALHMVRENFVMNFHRAELNYMTRAEAEFSTKFSRFINERNVLPIADELALARRDIAQNVNAKMVFFDFALKMIVLLIQ